LNFCKSQKTRTKFTKELSHFRDFRQDQFEEVRNDERKIIRDRIKSLSNKKDCYLISESFKLDKQRLDIDSALNEIIGQGIGTLIVFGDAEIVYYEGEGPSDRWISKPIE
jgi:hypothetical protein